MAIDQTNNNTVMRGLGLRDPGLDTTDGRWTAQETVTEAGPRPDTAVPSSDSEMVLSVSGEQASGTYQIQAREAGQIGPEGAAYVWRESSDTLWRGWEKPDLVTGYRPIRQAGGSIAATGNPDIAALEDGTILVAYYYETTTPTYEIRVSRVTTSNTLSHVSTAVQSETAAANDEMIPSLVVLPSGRILLFVMYGTSGLQQIDMYFSDDSGASWTQGAADCLKTPPATSNLNFFRVRLDGTGSTLLAFYSYVDTSGSNRNLLNQNVSTDLGITFEEIYESPPGSATATQAGAAIDMVPLGGTSWLLVVVGGDAQVRWLTLSSAFESFDDATRSNVDGTTFKSGVVNVNQIDDANISLVKSEEGRYYVHAIETTNHTGNVYEGTFSDNTMTWTAISSWWNTPTAGAAYPLKIAGVWQRGRVMLACEDGSNTTTPQNDVGVIMLGGHGSVTWGLWSQNWLPFHAPNTYGWTATGAGTDSAGSGGTWDISTSSNTRYFSRNPTATVDNGIAFQFAVIVSTGGSTSDKTVAAVLQVADGSDDYAIEIRFSTTQFAVVDPSGPTTIATVTIDTTAGVQILAAVQKTATNTGAARVWYRAWDPYNADRNYILGASSDALGNAATASVNLYRVGHIDSGTASSKWIDIQTSNNATPAGLADGQTNPDDLSARPFAAIPQHLPPGQFIKAIDGPAFVSDQWSIATRHDYELERVFSPSSPRIRWRSTGVTQERIALQYSSTLGDVGGHLRGSVLAVGLFGCNFQSGLVEGKAAGGSWSTLQTFNMNDKLTGLKYTRRGNRIEVDTGSASTNTPFLAHNECAGWTFDFGTGAASARYRRILSNSSGKWTNGSAKRPVLILEDVDGTEASSGTCSLWPTSAVLLVDLLGADYSGIRITIDAQDTVDGYFEIGRLFIGHFAAFGEEYGWGRVVETEAGATLTTRRDRTITSRIEAPPRRRFELGWVYGVNETQAQFNSSGDPADPDFFAGSTTSGAEAIAALGEIPAFLEGALRETDGPHRDVLILPTVGQGDTRVLNRRENHALCRIMGPIRRENVLGEECVSELTRVTLELEEVV